MIDLVLGDITDSDFDVIVNAANNWLLGGGGVDGAIHRVGGPAILEECKKLRETRFPDGLPTGEAVETAAGNLKAKWVIHTVGPRYGSDENPAELLRAAYRNSFELAKNLGAKTIAFPAISAGIFGYPIEEAAAIAVEVARVFEKDFERISFVLFSQDKLDHFKIAISKP